MEDRITFDQALSRFLEVTSSYKYEDTLGDNIYSSQQSAAFGTHTDMNEYMYNHPEELRHWSDSDVLIKESNNYI